MGAILAGHYHVVRPLGSGGFGQTFLARDSHLPGKPLCVVKQFKPRLNSANLIAAKRLFNLEAEVLYQLGSHEQIPRLLAHFEQDGEFYLVQEYIEGWSLDRELQQKRWSEAEVITLLKDILEVLAFVHTQNVIHRDIKPSNLMRRKADRKIVLIDFGAVKQVNTQSGSNSGQTNFTVAIGSPGYMPAEQQSSMPQFSSDVYAVGMIALQALTGTAVRDLPRDPNTGEIHPRELGISLELAAVLEKMVRYDYRQRYTNATEALAAVQALNPGQQPSATNGLNTVIPQSQFTETQIQPLQHTYDQDETLPPSSLPIGRSPFVRSAQPSSLVSNNYFSNAATISRASAPALSRQEYRNRQALLSKVKHYWIRGVLEASLHDQVMLVLGIETRPDAVASPWNITWETQQNSALTVPHGIPIIALFNQLGTGRTLLILGEPGAGKTTTLLELARDLIAQAEEDVDQLIPVVLNLSSWSAPTPIAEWIVKELNAKYQVPEKISRPWVEQQQLLLLLDGLDEVPLEYREACVVALNQFQQQYSTEMVVCSRMRDYEALPQRLAFQSAIYLRSLTLPQIHHYLNTLNVDLTGLKTLLTEDEALQELAQSPLMLNMMVLAYQGVAAADVSEVLLVEERRRQLFNAYIECMFRRRNDGRYSPTQTIDWLSWLAK
ncbi:MAG TPA: protein kinase, partial [Allocoleopsis sp.]